MTAGGAGRLALVPDEALTDAEIISLSGADPERFGEIYARHAHDVRGFAVSRLGHDGAEDVTAETFIAAFRIRDRFDATRVSARPWLMGIAVRQIANRKRAERARYRMLATLTPELPTEGPAERVGELVAAHALRGPLAAALARLRAPDRDVLLLMAWADLSYAEAAEALDIPIGTVRSRLSRARRVLRTVLPDLIGPDRAGRPSTEPEEDLPWTS